jgi:HAE1 family hydrophobic/amphiphilic exporter-1
MGMTVFAGMLIATILAVCLIPVLFVAVSRISGSKPGTASPPEPAVASHGGGH